MLVSDKPLIPVILFLNWYLGEIDIKYYIQETRLWVLS